jgi:hypothetical protein
MAGRPPTDPKLVAEALRRVDAGMHRDDVAAQLAVEGRPISVATIRRAQASRKPSKAPKAPRVAPRRKKPLAPPPRPAVVAPAPIPLLPDALEELTAALELTKGQLAAAAGRHGYGQIGNLFDKLLKTKAAIEAQRARPGADLAALLAKGPLAVAKIRQGRAMLARQEIDSGCCAACGGGPGGKLTDEQLTERRTRAA